jgi:uncharacterized protein YigA (DUF484 family)
MPRQAPGWARLPHEHIYEALEKPLMPHRAKRFSMRPAQMGSQRKHCAEYADDLRRLFGAARQNWAIARGSDGATLNETLRRRHEPR